MPTQYDSNFKMCQVEKVQVMFKAAISYKEIYKNVILKSNKEYLFIHIHKK